MPDTIRPPTRTFSGFGTDSSRWDRFQPRRDDIVIATYPKCGTTWMQRIVDLLVFQSAELRDIGALSPWLDWTVLPLEATRSALEAQTHRRFIKSHLPFDSLPIYAGVKYIHVARDGRDACMSMHNHNLGFNTALLKAATPPGGVRPTPTEDPREHYLAWIGAAEAYPSHSRADELPFFEFELTYWRERHAPNLLFVHFNDLKADLVGEMARISAFLDIETPPTLLGTLAEAATFERMRRDGDVLIPRLKLAFDRGAERFINKGTNGRWRDVLTTGDVARYDALVTARFPPELATWIEHGRHGVEHRQLG